MLNRILTRVPWLHRFRRDSRGSAALEFAIVALPFFSLLLAIFETTAVFFANSTLENAVKDAARQIRTGQVQNGGVSATQFTNLVCAEITPLLACDANLSIDIRSFPNFAAINFPQPLDASGNLQIVPSYSPGASGDIVLVRAFYTWHVVTPLIGATLANMPGNKHLISTAVAFRNEPF